MFLLESRWDAPLALGAAFLFFYTCYGAFYRLYLSPIAKFPGPKFAALTFWYEFYYDVYKRGKYTWKLKELHEEYGVLLLFSFVVHFCQSGSHQSSLMQGFFLLKGQSSVSILSSCTSVTQTSTTYSTAAHRNDGTSGNGRRKCSVPQQRYLQPQTMTSIVNVVVC